jgi:hypothetical protein
MGGLKAEANGGTASDELDMAGDVEERDGLAVETFRVEYDHQSRVSSPAISYRWYIPFPAGERPLPSTSLQDTLSKCTCSWFAFPDVKGTRDPEHIPETITSVLILELRVFDRLWSRVGEHCRRKYLLQRGWAKWYLPWRDSTSALQPPRPISTHCPTTRFCIILGDRDSRFRYPPAGELSPERSATSPSYGQHPSTKRPIISDTPPLHH